MHQKIRQRRNHMLLRMTAWTKHHQSKVQSLNQHMRLIRLAYMFRQTELSCQTGNSQALNM